jgi:L-asparagine oxygenase
MSGRQTPIRTIGSPAVQELRKFAEELVDGFATAAHPALADLVPACASQLSDELHAACRAPRPNDGAFILRGLRVDDADLGPTPPSWCDASPRQTPVWDVMLLLLGSVLGRPFGWAGQQNGRLVHDILPTRGQEAEQTGASSSVVLSPHTEDAFHPERAHLVVLASLRNPDGIGTSTACVRHVDIDPADRAILTRPRLPILPDSSYGDDHGAALVAPPVSTLWERRDGLCSRFDPAYTPLDRADEAFRAAYRRLDGALTAALSPVPTRPGDVLVLDNDTVVHGRAPFTPRYDGTDRWIKRVNVRLPGRERPPSESAEHGYGQQTIDLYRTAVGTARSSR